MLSWIKISLTTINLKNIYIFVFRKNVFFYEVNRVDEINKCSSKGQVC